MESSFQNSKKTHKVLTNLLLLQPENRFSLEKIIYLIAGIHIGRRPQKMGRKWIPDLRSTLRVPKEGIQCWAVEEA